MRKNLINLLVLLLCFCLSSCNVIKYILEPPPPSKEEIFLQRVQNFTQGSLYNINYNTLKLNPESFVDKKIRVFGVIVEEFDRDFLLFTNPFEDNEYGFYRIKIDAPLPKQGDYPKPLKYISRGSEVNVFGIYKGLTTIKPEQISTESKRLNPHIDFTRLRNIPTIEAVVIYDRNDLRLERPVWVSQKFIKENY
ncbi:MAG: hypothetical protein N3F03_04575 [Ignavibacteria bacterium]|nr:hypothetical protein [Ignavibacteria bacterium]